MRQDEQKDNVAKATVIDTGQSLGKNVMIQNGKVVSLGKAGSSISGVSTIASTSTTEAAPDSTPVVAQSSTEKTIESKTYFSSGENVRIYRDTSGGYWLSVSPVVSFLIAGLVVGGAVFALLTASALQRKKERRALRAQNASEDLPAVEQGADEVKNSVVENIVDDLIEDIEPIEEEFAKPVQPVESLEEIDESEPITPPVSQKPKFKKISL